MYIKIRPKYVCSHFSALLRYTKYPMPVFNILTNDIKQTQTPITPTYTVNDGRTDLVLCITYGIDAYDVG